MLHFLLFILFTNIYIVFHIYINAMFACTLFYLLLFLMDSLALKPRNQTQLGM
jgi:hypothetical protein